MAGDSDDVLLRAMYDDNYYLNFLVDKIKEELESLIECLEEEDLSIGEIQGKLDEFTIAINDLELEFDENNSQIETLARESIAESIEGILNYYQVHIDIETAIRERDW